MIPSYTIDVAMRGRWATIRRGITVYGEPLNEATNGEDLVGYYAAKAFLELQRKANEMKLFVFDTETGGLDPAQHSLLTLAGVVWQDGKIIDQIDLLIHEPNMSTTPEAMKVNGIDLGNVINNGLKPEDAVSKLESFLRRHWGSSYVPLAGHNVQFDVGFLKRLYTLAGVYGLETTSVIEEKRFARRYSYRLVDTQTIGQFLDIAGLVPVTNHKLGTLIDAYGVTRDAGEQHNALADATYTARLLTKMIERVQPVATPTERCM